MNERNNLRDLYHAITLKHDDPEGADLTPGVLFIDDVAKVLRVSRSTIERRRRHGSFPVPELPCLDSRPRWSRQAVERFLASTTNGMMPRRRHGGRR